MDAVIFLTKNLILTLILLQKIPKIRFIHTAFFDLETPKLYKIKIKRNKKIHQLRNTNFYFILVKLLLKRPDTDVNLATYYGTTALTCAIR